MKIEKGNGQINAQFNSMMINVKYPVSSLVGAIGDGVANDTIAIQAIITYCQDNNKKCFFPVGTYLLDTISFNNHRIVVEGESWTGTVIKANSVIDAIFDFDDVSENSRSHFKNFLIRGEDKVNYGIYSNKITHATFENVKIQDTLLSAISLSNGWCNNLINCEFSGNTGNGFTTNGGNNNMVNFIGCKIFNNDGFAIQFNSGIATNINGCTIETNKKGGLYFTQACENVNIIANYFEGNAQIGFTFTSPSSINLKSDILFNGSDATITSILPAYPCKGVVIEGNTFSNNYCDHSINLLSGQDIKIKNNVNHGTSCPLVGVYGNTTYYQTKNVEINNNNGFTKDLDVLGVTDVRRMSLSTFEIPKIQKRNFAPSDSSSYTNKVTLSGGTIGIGDILFNGLPTLMITDVVGSSNIFGFEINLDDYPILQSQSLYIGAWVKYPTGLNARVYIGGAGYSSASTSTDTTWHWIEFQVVTGVTGIISFGFGKIGGVATDKVYFAKPTLAIVGANKEIF